MCRIVEGLTAAQQDCHDAGLLRGKLQAAGCDEADPARGFADDRGEAGVAQPFLHDRQDVPAGFGEDQTLGRQSDGGEGWGEQVGLAQDPQHWTGHPRQQAGDEQRGGGGVFGVGAAGHGLMQGVLGDASAWQGGIDGLDVQGQMVGAGTGNSGWRQEVAVFDACDLVPQGAQQGGMRGWDERRIGIPMGSALASGYFAWGYSPWGHFPLGCIRDVDIFEHNRNILHSPRTSSLFQLGNVITPASMLENMAPKPANIIRIRRDIRAILPNCPSPMMKNVPPAPSRPATFILDTDTQRAAIASDDLRKPLHAWESTQKH